MTAEIKEYEIWVEGYLDQGMEGIPAKAFSLGKFEGNTFKDAVQNYKNTLTDKHSINCLDVENLRFWHCKLFDNKQDASKLYG